jgi:deoxyguanosine kinase
MTAPPATRTLAPMPATVPAERATCNRRDDPALGPSEWPETGGSSAARFDPDSDGTHACSGTGDVRTDCPRAFGLFVAVEGVTGVGKTTLARKLTRALHGTLVLDPFDANPFLERLLRSERPDNASALRVELTFVALRIAQLREIGQAQSSGRTVIADWALIKQAIFAATTLPPVDVVRIAETVELWSRGVPQPDVLIGMSADPATICQRVRRRCRSMEATFSHTEAAALSHAFEAAYDAWDRRLIRLDASTFDAFLDSHVDELAAQLRQLHQPWRSCEHPRQHGNGARRATQP